MSPISEYLNETDGRWVGRLVYVEGGQRRERKRVFGPVHHGRGRPKAGAIPRAEAVERLAAVRAELELELARSPEQRDRRAHATLTALALAWLDDAGRSSGRPWKPSTERDYRSALGQSERGDSGHIIGALGNLRLDELTEQRMRAWWKSLDKLTSRTANKNLTILGTIFAWADRDGRWGRIDDPTRPLRSRPSDRAQGEAPRFFEPEEVEGLLAAARNPTRKYASDHPSRLDPAIFELAVQTGMRRGELLALRVGDVELSEDDPFVTIRRALSAGESTTPKSRRVRRVPLTEPAVAVLEPLCAGRDRNALVFAGPNGKQLDGDALSRRYNRARDRAGLPPLRFHDLRHSFGSQLARAGYDLPTIQAYYGHADLETTSIYLHHRPRAGDAKRLTQALNGNREKNRLRAVG
jgi:integrase